MPRLLPAALVGFGLIVAASPASTAQSDLDAFMQKVLARRDDNRKKLQQYILDERETIELRGPGRVTLWGERREYTWYIRDGFFVRSPLKFNGVPIGDADRLEYEGDFLHREKEREKRQAGRQPPERAPAAAPSDDEAPRDVESLILQTRQPQFISSAYFLRFKFEQGKYALVGREPMDGRELLRIEYYPENLFSRARTREQRRRQQGKLDQESARGAQMERLLNKVSRVTLWIDPSSHQIVKYTFENVNFDFLPARWLVRVDDLRATMTMSQPFPDVWLPRDLQMLVSMTLAIGQFDARYALDYRDYRRAGVTSRIRIPGDR
ncbi:MAG: hypothetical protein HYS05_11985 [Acidobacteria bacterium]|nr:hypothetical protein [Acidobacteriota bacterium]